jgi:hypothetical protein
MGEAKRRLRLDPMFGQPEQYQLQIIPCRGILTEQEVAEAKWQEDRIIPIAHYANPTETLITDQICFCVPRCQTATKTNLKAIAIAHTIVGFLTNPLVPEWIQKIADERCLGEGSLTVLEDIAKHLDKFYARLDGDLMDKDDRGEVIFTNLLEAANEDGFKANNSDAVWEIAIGKR